ncbi:MAG: DEAD/DEAH box helicase [Candidatus Omnitrophica bacterium]|nr:DEAD/DEAH box helicase [Candidatus Omnitrophota bacterium]
MDNEFVLNDPEDAQDFLASFEPDARLEGEACFRQGMVVQSRCDKPGIKYTVWVLEKNRHCEVVLFYNHQNGWAAECSCHHLFECKHIYAAMMTLLAENNVATVQALSSGNLRPSDDAIKGAAPAQSSKPKSPGMALADQLHHALGRSLRKQELDFLRRLEKVHANCRAKGGITRWDFSDLNLNLGGYSWDALQIWPAFPLDLHTFWLYLAHTAQEHNVPLPEFMLPVTDLSEIRERIKAWQREREIEHWKKALADNLTGQISPGAPVHNETELRLKLTAKKALLEYKPPGKDDFAAIQPRQSRRFHEDYRQGLILLSPRSELLWQVFEQRFLYGHPMELAFHDLEGLRVIGRLLRHQYLADQVVTEEGRPFARAQEPLRWALASDAQDNHDYCLRLAQADGAAPPPLLFTIDGSPPLYVTRDTVFAGPPLLSQVLDCANDNSIPGPALESVSGVQFLDRLGIELPARIRDRVKRVPMRVDIHVKLDTSYGNNRYEYCCIQVSAESADGSLKKEWNGFQWTKINNFWKSDDVPERDNVLVLYDQSILAQVRDLLEPLDLTFDSRLRALAVRVTRRFPELFANWLRSLPSHFQVHLDGELASLSSDAIAGRIRLEVTETEIDWFDLKVVLDTADTELTEEELRLLLNAKGGYVRLGKKGWRRLAINLTQEDDERLARLGLTPHELNAETQRFHALQLADEAAKKFLPAEQAAQIQRRAAEIKARVTPPTPDGLTAELRPYQIDGYHFLAYLAANRFGGILADDMGLGKTLQALAWLLWLRSEPGAAARPCLVVCPKSVMDNWQAEAHRFTPGLRIKSWLANEIETIPNRLDEADVHVLNYTQLRLMEDKLVPVHWLAVILDEGQYIKNPNSQTAQVARALHATYRLVLSGTPIENRLLDLWSLMAFTMPGVLGSRNSFARRFDGKIDPLARRRLAARMRPFLLRRTKSQVAKDLPEKIEEDLFCEIEGEQKSLYRAELKYAQQLLLKIKTQKQLAKSQFNFLASLLRLRQICCHPALVKPDSKATSAKVDALFEQLEPLMEEGQKVLVFSQFVELLDLLKPQLEARGWPLFYLTGATENRGELVRNFQAAQDEAVFLISLKAGGFGLNLTAASYVVLFDPWWNPAVENQAIDRTHRIGQVNKVIAYRLLIKDSIEEKIRALQRQKSQLAEDILGEEKFAQSLTVEDLKFLLAD